MDAAYNILAVSVSSRVQHGGADAFIGTKAAAVGGWLSATFRRMFALSSVALHQHLKTRCIRVWLLLVCDFERSVFGAPEPAAQPAPRVFHFGPSCIAKAQRSLSVNSASSGLVCYCYCALTCHRLQDSSACRGFPAMVSCAEEAARKSEGGRFSLSEMQMTKAGVYASKEEGGRLRLQLPSTGLSVQTTEPN